MKKRNNTITTRRETGELLVTNISEPGQYPSINFCLVFKNPDRVKIETFPFKMGNPNGRIPHAIIVDECIDK